MSIEKSAVVEGTKLTKLATNFDPEMAPVLEVVAVNGDDLTVKVPDTEEMFVSTVEILSGFYEMESALTKEEFPTIVARDVAKALELLKAYTAEASHGSFSTAAMHLTTHLYSMKEKADKLSGKEGQSATANKLAKR